MDMPTAFRNLAGAPHLLALRPRGPIVRMTDRQLLVDLRGGKARRYVGKFSDYVAIDWDVMTGEQLGALVAKQNAAAQGN
jgi:hypothetical protein